MLESFEYKGIFWLPSNPEDLKAGILKYTPEEGAMLELIDTSPIKAYENLPKPHREDIILGKVGTDIPVTLEDCDIVWRHPYMDDKEGEFSYYGRNIKPKFVYLGEHFQRIEEIKFNAISVAYRFLKNWVNLGNSLREDITLYESKKLKISLSLGSESETDKVKHTLPIPPSWLWKIMIYDCIKFELFKPQHLKEFIKYILIFQNFLTLAVGYPTYPISLKGWAKGKPDPYITILYCFNKKFSTREILHDWPVKILFTYKDISHKCHKILTNLLKKAEKLQPVFSLYFGTLYNPDLYMENKFLSLVSALESFHSRSNNFKDTYIPHEEYKGVLKQLIESIPPQIPRVIKKRLTDILKYVNEKSLRSRLKDILKHYGDITQIFIDDFDAFIQKVILTRNYYTHYDEDLIKYAANEAELQLLNLLLELLVQMCLLEALSFTVDDIKNLQLIRDEIQFVKAKIKLLHTKILNQ
jgi:hypothetical protein